MQCLSGKPPSGKGVHHAIDLALLSYTGWRKRHLTLTGDMRNILKWCVLSSG